MCMCVCVCVASQDEELKECVFTPVIHKQNKSYHRALRNPHIKPILTKRLQQTLPRKHHNAILARKQNKLDMLGEESENMYYLEESEGSESELNSAGKGSGGGEGERDTSVQYGCGYDRNERLYLDHKRESNPDIT